MNMVLYAQALSGFSSWLPWGHSGLGIKWLPGRWVVLDVACVRHSPKWNGRQVGKPTKMASLSLCAGNRCTAEWMPGKVASLLASPRSYNGWLATVRRKKCRVVNMVPL